MRPRLMLCTCRAIKQHAVSAELFFVGSSVRVCGADGRRPAFRQLQPGQLCVQEQPGRAAAPPRPGCSDWPRAAPWIISASSRPSAVGRSPASQSAASGAAGAGSACWRSTDGRPRPRPGRPAHWRPGRWRPRRRAGPPSGRRRGRSGTHRRATPPRFARCRPPPRLAAQGQGTASDRATTASPSRDAGREGERPEHQQPDAERAQSAVRTTTAPGRACGPAPRRGAGRPAGRWRRTGRSPP